MKLSTPIYWSMAIALLASLHARAENSSAQICNEDKTRCKVVGVSAATATASGIYAVKKYAAIRLFEKENTKTLFEHTTQTSPVKASQFQSQVNQVENGDKITINYQLSESENRQYHINLMESNARSADSAASSYDYQALTATKPIYQDVTVNGTDEDGNPTTTTRPEIVGEEPDWAARASAAAQAAAERANAAEYRAKAESARRGGPVPTYDFEDIFDKKDGNSRAVAEFIKNHEARQSKIFKIARLPAAQYAALRKMLWTARGAVGMAVGYGVLAGEEALIGAVSERIQNRNAQNRPQIMNRDSFEGAR